jgi:hypothetical protein
MRQPRQLLDNYKNYGIKSQTHWPELKRYTIFGGILKQNKN